MRETYRQATARARREKDVPIVRIAHPTMQNFVGREMPDIYDARRMVRRFLRFMVRAGWTMSGTYCIPYDGGATITAEMVREGDVCRVSVDGGATTWRGMYGVTPARFVVSAG